MKPVTDRYELRWLKPEEAVPEDGVIVLARTERDIYLVMKNNNVWIDAYAGRPLHGEVQSWLNIDIEERTEE